MAKGCEKGHSRRLQKLFADGHVVDAEMEQAAGVKFCFRCSCGHIMKLSWDPVGNWELTICSIVDIVGPKWELGI
eukprot:COSAG02_NODE_463_length_21833_cov_11.529539_11_plen_75_part_00